jgi:hypothetical protein
MIYRSREKATNRHIIWAQAMGALIKAKRDSARAFSISKTAARLKKDNEAGPIFVGYARPLRGCAASNLSI